VIKEIPCKVPPLPKVAFPPGVLKFKEIGSGTIPLVPGGINRGIEILAFPDGRIALVCFVSPGIIFWIVCENTPLDVIKKMIK
jgi:hypothetical protein